MPAALARRDGSRARPACAEVRIVRRPAHGARRGRPAGRLRLRRHRPGAARHRRLRRRGQGRRRARARDRRAERCRPATTSSGPASTSSSQEMLARMKIVIPLTLLIIVAAALPAVPELHRGADRPAVDPVRAGRQRLAAVAARLPALDGGVGRHHRAGRARGADRHRDDRLHRPRLRAAQGGGADPQPRRHHRGAHGGDGAARAAQADDRVDDADRPGAAALGARARAPTS